MPRGKNCRETIFAAQLPRNHPRHEGNFEGGENVLSCGGEAIWEAFRETIWARVIESQKLPRDSGESIFAARHQDVSQGPLGKEKDLTDRFLTGMVFLNFQKQSHAGAVAKTELGPPCSLRSSAQESFEATFRR